MKKLFLTMSLAVASLLLFANPPKKENKKGNYPYAANQSLMQMYGEVENLRWSDSKDERLRADFQIDGENFSTFFERDGKFVATTHDISFEQLPAMARKPLKAKFQGVEFSKIVYYQSNETASYFVEVVEEGETSIYKVSSEGHISRFK
jgi:hypothetical protein